MRDMSSSPTDQPRLARPLPWRQRLVVDAAAVMLVLTAGLVGALPPPPPILPVASATPTPIPVATQPSSTPVASELLKFPATADTYVYAGRPELNYGTATELRVDSDPETLTYLKFTVSGITTPVLGATLRIHALGRQTIGFQVRTADGDWSESKLTYAAQPAQGTVAGNSGLIAGEATIEVVLAPVITGDGQFSFVLFTTGTTALAFASREAGDPTAPVLVVEVARAPGG